MLDQVPTQPGKCRPDPARGPVLVSAENLAGGGDESMRCRRDGRMQAGTERVGSAPLTSVNRLFRYPDFTW